MSSLFQPISDLNPITLVDFLTSSGKYLLKLESLIAECRSEHTLNILETDF